MNAKQIADRESKAYSEGVKAGRIAAEVLLRNDRNQLQLETLRAIIPLLQEAGKMMSRAGYMIGKASGKDGF